MNKIKIYGIKNCDTMKKTFRWMDDEGLDYEFHDYKKQGVDEDVLSQSMEAHDWEIVINKRGTTWRKLPEHIQSTMNKDKALEVAKDNASIVKRPIFKCGSEVLVGFSDETKTALKNLV